MRVIYVPQYPTQLRYQEWWWWRLPEEFAKAGLDVLILGANYAEMTKPRRAVDSMFSPIDSAIELECAQIKEYMELELRDDDILFVSDISFPGLFCNVLFHKRPSRAFTYCHATSLNYKDYFASVRQSKFPAETGHSELFDVVFLGSNYHEDKLNWSNTLVVRLPYPPLETFKSEKKDNLLISASRPNEQKVDIDLECVIEDKFNYPIVRKNHSNWEDYYKFLSRSKILIISSFEDTFGYQIVDAVINGCIPLAPTRCSYPEILPREYLYADEYELIKKINYIINSDHGVPYLWEDPTEVQVPQLLCHEEMENFYKNIIQVMKGEPE